MNLPIETADLPETPDPAVTRVLHAMTDRLHASLCNCAPYPASCYSKAQYRRDELVHTLTYAEDALDVAIEQGWTPPGVAGETTDDVVQDEEVERLRAQVAAWQAHASEMEKQLNHIEHLASRGLDKDGFEKPSDVLTEIYDSAEAPARPAALDETAAAQETQEMPSTAECVLSEYEGPEACFERDCEEYVDDEGNDRPEVERCSHIREVAPTTDEESASPTA